MNAQLPIGVMDSGVGGLSVLRELLVALPDEHFVYLADEAYLPYGDKPIHEIAARTLRIAEWFYAQPCKAMVLACNTATAAAAESIRQHFPNWMVLGIEPAVKPAALMSASGRVGILATSNTLASEKFRRLVARFEDVADVVSVPCPGLVELIERQPLPWPEVDNLLRPRVKALIDQAVDVIVLGCTHYPFVAQTIAKFAGNGVQIIDTGIPVARHLKQRLNEEGCQQNANPPALTPQQRVRFLTTGSVEEFRSKLSGLLGEKWDSADLLPLRL